MPDRRPASDPPPLDRTDREILRLLEEDARISWADLGRRVNLTAPAARDRVRRLERDGVITGHGTWIDPARVGKPIGAYIRVTTTTPMRNQKLVEFARERPEVAELHTLTGDDSVIMRVQVGDLAEIDALTTSLAHFGQTNTSLVLASPIPWRNVLAR